MSPLDPGPAGYPRYEELHFQTCLFPMFTFHPAKFADFFIHFADFLCLKNFFELLLYTECPIYYVNFHIVTIYGTVSDKERFVVG